MKLYLVRHGESEFNKERLHQDHTPLLSERGIEQAHFVARRLNAVPLTTIIASPYPRAKHTAEVIAEHLNLPLGFSDLLVETRRPTEVVGQGHESDIAREIDRLYRENIDDPDWKYSDEESLPRCVPAPKRSSTFSMDTTTRRYSSSRTAISFACSSRSCFLAMG